MTTTAPIGLGILAVAALFGVIAGGVALVVYEFGFVAALFIAILVALIVMLILWLGWRDPAPTMQESNAAAKAEMEANRSARATSDAMTGETASDAGAAAANAHSVRRADIWHPIQIPPFCWQAK